MSVQNRRQYRRTRLRLRIAQLEGVGMLPETHDLWTTDVSAGGMFFSAPLAAEPAPQTPLSFELNVPPGEGYSTSAGTVRGSGKVVRAIPVAEDQTGVAVQFTRPLALDF